MSTGGIVPLPSAKELLQAVISNLPAAVSPSLTSGTQPNDLYEWYLWSLIIRAARETEGTIRFEAASGRQTSSLRFRTSPGRINSRTSQFTHGVLAWDGCPPLEVHVGARVLGRSGVLHECDVLVIDRREAQRCRINGVDPRAKIELMIEAKFYSTDLRLRLAREFIGLSADVTAKTECFVTNSNSVPVARLLSNRTEIGHFNTGVTPGSKESDDLLAFFRQAFRRFKSR